MQAKDYLCVSSKKGYLIDNAENADLCGIQNAGRLTIAIGTDDAVTITYKDAYGQGHTVAAKSWNDTHDVKYLRDYNSIVGTVHVYDLSDETKFTPRPFLITLDRASEAVKGRRRIHVYVGRGGGGTPDDGSYTGDDR